MSEYSTELVELLYNPTGLSGITYLFKHTRLQAGSQNPCKPCLLGLFNFFNRLSLTVDNREFGEIHLTGRNDLLSEENVSDSPQN